MSAIETEHYLDQVRERLRGAGFQLLEAPAGVEVRAHDRGFKASRFGIVDEFLTVARADAPATPEALREFSRRWFETDARERSGPPRGLFAQLVSYPVLMVETASGELRDFVSGYAPKHWSALEFPSVVDLTAGELLCCRNTPAWGAAYYKTSRNDVRALAAPDDRARNPHSIAP